ncbi:MAG: SDR family NAD(P)-dependent oxidoreductase [Oleiphilaceae bacterium]|nr:SDR family NAD(P)-dependent oxidoreductase [Oleiphilaceae bacterium]
MKNPFKQHNAPSRKARAVITGAGSSIGRSFALELARRGGEVVCADLDLASARETVALVQGLGARGHAIQCDVGKSAQVKKLAAESERLLDQPVTLVINNAGVGLGGRFQELTLEDWRWCMDVNLWGVIHGCHYFVPRFLEQGHGAIINVASAASYTAAPEMSAYNVTKSGVMALSETLSAELRKHRIPVNVLCPTLVPTNIIRNGRIPGRYAKLADSALMNFALTTSDKVARLTLDRLDRGHLYTTPQIDARMLWRAKRASPGLYARFLGFSYRFVQ